MLKVKWQILIFLFLGTNVLLAQKQANLWYFGEYAGIDFNGGSPKALTNSAMKADEGCASISDGNGKLLFYTNGVNVWNSSHKIMPNGSGLNGNISSTQCCIVPLPSNPNIFYLFTVDCSENRFAKGLCYSVIDLRAQGGLGDVTTKNINLMSPACEKVTACHRKDYNEYWIVTHKWNSDSFYSFRLTASGISGSPVISRAGDVITEFLNDRGTGAGYMKISSDGKKLAAASHESGTMEIFNFDDATGRVTSRIFKVKKNDFTYGVEFSSNSKRLYLSAYNDGIYQYDVSTSVTALIQKSETKIYPLGQTLAQPGALQLAPDHKIYVAIFNANALDVISDPDAKGTACNYTAAAVSLNYHISSMGLPDFIKPFFHPSIVYTDTCLGSITSFSMSDTVGVDSVQWSFGDTVNNSSTSFTPKHYYAAAGKYLIKLVGYVSGHKDSVKQFISISPPPLVNLGGTRTICGSDSMQLDAYCPGCSYHWQDGSAGSFIVADRPGKYWVQVKRGQCIVSDTAIVSGIQRPELKLGRDTLLCAGQMLILRSGYSGQMSCRWQDGSTADSLAVHSSGKYRLTVRNYCGAASDSINVYYVRPPEIHFGGDTLICGKPDFWLNAAADSASYLWQDNSRNFRFHVTHFGEYTVKVKNHCGYAEKTITVRPKNPLYVFLGKDTDLCAGTKLILRATTPNANTYLWQDGSTDSSYMVEKPGKYFVMVQNSCGYATDTINIDYTNPPAAHFGKDTLVCGVKEFRLDASSDKAEYLWQDGSRQPYFQVEAPGTYSVLIKNHCGTVRRTIHVRENDFPVVFLGNDTTVCDSFVLTAHAPATGYRYRWQNGSHERQLEVTASGAYSVSVSNECGTARDTIHVTVELCECPMYMPNSFTPNGDGINDVFRPSSCVPKQYVMRIYNRWGEQLFETSDINTGWDGRFEGEAVPEGAYMYVISGAKKSGGFFNRSGVVYVFVPSR